MLEQLKFVQGAVSKKDLVPSMTHFRIERGTVRAYNGTLAICSPIALDIDCCPKAADMVNAISKCAGATTISLTPAGKLRIKSGPSTFYVETIEGETVHVQPAGQRFDFDGAELVAAFKAIEPFIGTDASRQFTTGVLLDGQSAYATNNVCLVQYWLGNAFPLRVNVPRACIKEIIRIGEPPTHGQVDQGSITFHYTDGRWIRSQLISTEWPLDLIGGVLDKPSDPKPLPADFFTGLEAMKGMSDGAARVYMRDGALRTSINDDEGATYEIDLPSEGLYNLQMLSLLEGVVKTIDFTRYPAPALFFGDRLRGAIIGMAM